MTTYKYETHLHTAEMSKCARSPGAELAEYYHALGYTGLFVTDHFFDGSTAVAPELPWHERVACFCGGYDAVAARGAQLGLDVFFAWEYSLGWAHFLTYGLEKAWLLAHPDIKEWDILEYFNRVHAGGGFIVHAHPFREHVELVQLIPGSTDAVEIINANRSDAANQHARDFANSFGLPHTAGSDIHSTRQQRRCGVVTSQRFTVAGDYLAALQSGDAVVFDEITA